MENGFAEFRASDPKFATKAIHAGQSPSKWTSRAVVPPISLSTTFQQPAPGEHLGYEYARSGNPTRLALEECLAALDDAKYGLCFASGLAATTTVCHMLESGQHVISMNDVYGGTNRLFRKILKGFNIETSFVDCTDVDKVRDAIQENTRMIWIESPSNPTLRLVDIEAIANVIEESGKKILLVVDNTFMTSYFQRPLSLGADICLYSLTKYMNGHTDVVMGAITINNDDIFEKLKFLQNAIGTIPSPFDCYLVNRGLKTLHLRMKEHMKNSMRVAKFLSSHKLVESVLYPGLPSHPEYELAKRQCSGFTGMVSFYIKGGLVEAKKFLMNLKVFTLAESLGGYESLAEHPAIMTHASVPEEERKILNISDNLIRLSVGIEASEDLIEDLDQALKKSSC